jgi:hypothetical protein
MLPIATGNDPLGSPSVMILIGFRGGFPSTCIGSGFTFLSNHFQAEYLFVVL